MKIDKHMHKHICDLRRDGGLILALEALEMFREIVCREGNKCKNVNKELRFYDLHDFISRAIEGVEQALQEEER